MWPKSINKILIFALPVGLALRLFFIRHYPFASGDTPYYEELARNWLYHGVYGFFSYGICTHRICAVLVTLDFWPLFIPSEVPEEVLYFYHKRSSTLPPVFSLRALPDSLLPGPPK